MGPSTESRKLVTVVFIDVSGSTGLGDRLDPESVRSVMERYFDTASRILLAHGGTVEKFIGDAVMAVFGIPQMHEDDALRAVRAACELRDALPGLNEGFERDWGVSIATRTGINTGEVVVGDPRRGHTLVTGDAVNVAARLEQAAVPGEILIGDATRGLARDALHAEPVEPITARGKTEPVTAWRLLEVRGGAPAYLRRMDTPLVDRRHELSQLKDAFARAVRERACSLFTIVGAAGIGKSRLAGEFLWSIDQEARVLSGRCLPYGEGITYWPLAEIVRHAAGENAAATIRKLMAGDEDAKVIAELVAGAAGQAGVLGSTDETIWAVRRFLEVLARDRPLVVVFEDIHWAEPTFLDLIERVAQWARDAPITLVCLARNELLDVRPSWGGGLFNATSILLEPLSQGEADELIDHLLGDVRMLPDTRRRVAAIAEGNPLFMEQLLSSLGEGEEASDLTAPASVQAVIAARLDRLDEPERTLLECASLVGKEFRAEEVLELAGVSDGSEARGALQTLVRKDLIRPARSVFHGDSAFRFRHILIRDAAYGRIPKARRSQLHERLAEHVDRTSGPTGAELEEIIGYHYEQAFRLRAELGPLDTASTQLATRAGERLGHAGRRALNRGDTPAATALLERAVEVLVPAQAERLECMLDLATAASWAGDYDRATTILDDTLAAAAAAGDRRVEARALVGRAHLQQVRSESSEEPVTATCEAAIPVFERAGDDRGLAEAFLRIGHAHMRRGHYGRATQVLERALEHALRLDMTPERVTILGNLALALWIGPVPADEAVSRTREIIARAAALHPLAAFNATVPLALLQASRGRIADARRLLAHVQTTADEVKVPETIGFVSYYIGLVELLAGDVSAAEGDLRTSVALFQSQTGRTGLADAASALAQCLLGRGAVDEASALAELSRTSATGLDAGDEVGWRIAIARTRARAGDADLALGIAQEAVAWAHQTDSPLLQGDALIALAEAHRSSRDAAAAGVAIDEALICYERKGAVVAARRARAMRRTLGRQIARRGRPR